MTESLGEREQTADSAAGPAAIAVAGAAAGGTAPAVVVVDPGRVSLPRAVSEIDARELRSDVLLLARSRLFWVGVALKVGCALLFGSHFATRWFAPFVYQFVHGHFADPWSAALAHGEPLAFPYGPGMLVILSTSWLPALFTSFDPASHLGLLLLRLPLLAADLVICLVLLRWARTHVHDVIVAYWMSPVVLYATYIHGQLDLVPTALLCAALFLMFAQRVKSAALVFGIALATKGHLLIAFPFAVIYLYRRRRTRYGWLGFGAITALTTAALYALPLRSPAFRSMVLGSAEAQKVWAVTIAYAASTPDKPGLMLFVAPAMLLVALLRYVSYRKVNRELTIMFLGALYVALVALVPPQPGWFIWSIPFVAYLGIQFTRTGRFALGLLTVTYLSFFFVDGPEVFLEAFDPVLGAGVGARTAALLTSAAPGLFGVRAASVAWTTLFAATSLTAFEMYRKGVRSNSLYNFRDETFMIGVGGDSGAGKHTLGADIAAVMGTLLSLINGDDDHKWERGHAMWRRFTHLDPRGNLLSAQSSRLAALRRGGAVRRRHYDHDIGKFTDPILLKPTDFVCIIGLHPFYLASQRQLLHLRVFVDPVEDLRREWKVARDVAKRGYSAEKVIGEIERRMSDSAKYVKPQMKYADVILRNGPVRLAEGSAASIDQAVNLEVELVSVLEPLLLVDVLEDASNLDVTWSPDPSLQRDTITVTGVLDVEDVKQLAIAVIPNLDELVNDMGAWESGARGLAQIVILHSIGARLRASAPFAEVT